MELLNCPKCKGLMEEGFVVDYAHGGARKVSTWAEGQPTVSFWEGLKVKEQRKISAFRCTSCGYLESYAR